LQLIFSSHTSSVDGWYQFQPFIGNSVIERSKLAEDHLILPLAESAHIGTTDR
jgi:hypothetical protein